MTDTTPDDQSNQERWTIETVKILLSSHAAGDEAARNEIQKIIQVLNNAAFGNGTHNILRMLVSAGFGTELFPAMKQFRFVEKDITRTPNQYYLNAYVQLGCVDFLKNGTLEEFRTMLKKKILFTYEQFFFRTFYDPIENEMRRSENNGVIRLNHIAREINERIETITLDEMKQLYSEVLFILYPNTYESPEEAREKIFTVKKSNLKKV